MTPEMLATLTEQVAELVQTYSNNYLQFQRATYNETQVRVDFVNRFFKLLGWDVDNERGLPQHLREVTHEATVVVEEDGVHRSKKPDYSFKVGTEVLYFLETKKPAVNLTIDAAPAFQLRRYGWSGNLKVSVLTNFTDLYIYDCSVRPREGDDIGVAMIAHYHFDEYVERFEEIYNMLSKEAVLTGQFERHFGNIQGALRREPFDQYFLDQIRAWRMMLGEDILCNNPNVDAETLNIFVQRVLNRTIFLRICEDRCFENYESLKAITTYQDLRTMFAAADQKYDSGLFELLEEDRLTVSDSVIIEIFQSLDYPNNSYDTPVYFDVWEVYRYIKNKNAEVISKKEGDPHLPKRKDGSLINDPDILYLTEDIEFAATSQSAANKASAGPYNGEFERFITRLETKLSDKRLKFITKPEKGDGTAYTTGDFAEILKQFLGYIEKCNVTIIDLSAIPFEVLSIVISLLSRIIFDFAFHYSKLRHHEGKVNDIPFMLVCEEAHNYIPKSGGAEYAASKHSIERIAKEGRKYGLSLMVVSQRPSEVSDTIFSQCNNFVVLKLTNINDQNCIKNLLPDNNSSLVDVLPTLSAGECLIVGDAAPLPAVIKMDMPNPIPNSSNVNVYDEWNKNWIDIAFETVIKRWWKE